MKKTRIVSVLCLVLMLMLCIIPAHSAEAETTGTTGYIKTPQGGTCVWREGPSKNYKKIGDIPYRTKVTVYSYSGNYALVKPTGKSTTGYVHKSYLVYSDPGAYKKDSGSSKDPTTMETLDKTLKALKPLKTPRSAAIKTKRATNTCHLRWIPCTDGRTIGKYLAGEPILVLAESKTWAQVQICRNSQVGFILKANVSDLYTK